MKIIIDDAIKAMGKINKKVDMIFADNPYESTKNKKDKRINTYLLWFQYQRLIKDNGVIALTADMKYAIELISKCTVPFRYDLIWNKVLKTGFLNSNRMPLRQHELVLIFYKKLSVYNPQFTEGKPLHGKGKAYLNKEIVNNNYGKFHATDDLRKGSTQKYPSSIINISKTHPTKAKHRTEKPIELIEYLIKTYTNPGDTMLDNACGCGNTAYACLNTGRDFILIDKDKTAIEEKLKKYLIKKKSENDNQ